MIAFAGVEGRTAVLVRDKYFVGIIKGWFDLHAQKHHQSTFINQGSNSGF